MGYMLMSDKPSYNQTSLYDRVKKLLVSYEWSDCSFSISGEKIKAHKLILGISSPVFEAMFYGPLSSKDDIIVTDIQPDIFQLMLNYIYTDTVDLTCIEQAYELLYVSRKYILEHLTNICVAYIQANISVDNVVEILNYPDYMQDKQLVTFALKLFCEHANYLIEEKKEFITTLCMKMVLESDQMNISEKDLIMHVFEWSKHLCVQNNIPSSVENRRNLLNNIGLLKLLRFSTINANDFEQIVFDENNLLLPHESENIRKAISNKQYISSNIQFVEVNSVNTIPRNILKLQWYLCYRSPLRSMTPIIIDSNNYVIHSRIKSNKSIFINSLCIPTRMAPAVHFRDNSGKFYTEQLSVSISCESDDNVTKSTNFVNNVEYDSIVDVELAEPYFIRKSKWHKISFTWPCNRFPTYSYVVEFRDKKYTGHKVTFEFDDLPLNAGNGGSFLGGLKFCL